MISHERFPNPRRKCILVVDDDQQFRRAMKRFLSEHGYYVVEAEDGEEAIRLCGRVSFSLILMDVRMPNVDGLVAARLIRDSLFEQAPIVAVSANPEVERLVSAPDSAFDGFIPKPVDPDQLLKIIDSLTLKAILEPETKNFRLTPKHRILT